LDKGIREPPRFIDYVNKRTWETSQLKQAGEKFPTVDELQKELAVPGEDNSQVDFGA